MLNLHNYKRTDGGYEGPTGLMEGTLHKDKVLINSPAPYTSNNFCGLNKNVGDPYYMIDGNNESVWANVNLNEANFSFDFKDSNFLL